MTLGRIDVGFARTLPKTQAGRFVQDHVYRDCIVAVLPADHAFAGLRKISLQQLANEDWVFLSRSTEPEMVDDFTTLCATPGFSPCIVSAPLGISALSVDNKSGQRGKLTQFEDLREQSVFFEQIGAQLRRHFRTSGERKKNRRGPALRDDAIRSPS